MFRLLVGLFLLVGAFGEPVNDVFEHGRILGGKDAVLGQFPHMASLRVWYIDGWYHNCGGSLITPNWILTAAHCLTGYTEKQIKVYLGTVITHGDDGDVYDAELLISHPDFSITPIHDDIGLIKLTKDVTFTANIKPIRLSEKAAASGSEVTISGFGRIENAQSPAVLQYLTQTVWDNERCNNSLTSPNLNDKNVCAINGQGKAACNGDSGSPLISGNRQVGIASWVRKPCGSNYPDVYVGVNNYLRWISLEVTNNS